MSNNVLRWNQYAQQILSDANRINFLFILIIVFNENNTKKNNYFLFIKSDLYDNTRI